MDVSGLTPRNGPDGSRLRFLGGSTNHWGGWHQPVSRQVIDQWPVTFEEIEKYHSRTVDVLGIQDRSFYRIEEWRQSDDQFIGSFGPGILSSVRQIRALRFWEHYRDEFAESENLTVLKNTNIYDFEFSPDANFVTDGVLKNLDGRKRTISAKLYVIACGGLENPQILLSIDRLSGGVLTRKTGAIGKYYMDHASLRGKILPFRCIRPDLADWRHFPEYGDNPVNEGDYYFVRPAFRLDPDIAEYRGFPQHGIMLEDFHPDCIYKTENEFENLMRDSEFHAVSNGELHPKKGPLPPVYLDFAPSQNFASTVELTDRKNALGHSLGQLNWSLNSDDVLLAIGIAKAFETRMAENGIARIRLIREIEESGLLTEFGTARNDSHHMGATRMSDSPKNGVVDRNCKIHGLENCYIAGASVFPSYDWAGPTFTALALALRLADHLKNKMA